MREKGMKPSSNKLEFGVFKSLTLLDLKILKKAYGEQSPISALDFSEFPQQTICYHLNKLSKLGLLVKWNPRSYPEFFEPNPKVREKIKTWIKEWELV